MKYFTLNTRSVLLLVFIFCFSICLTMLTSCRTMRTSEKAVSKSETASVTESRLTFYRTIDSLTRQLNLSVDSISIIFQNPIWPEFPSAVPSGIEGRLETPSDKKPPNKITVYGLHLNENIGEKSISQADLKDSVTAVTQSEKVKSATKQSSSPSNAPKYIFYILLLACALYGIYRLRRFLK